MRQLMKSSEAEKNNKAKEAESPSFVIHSSNYQIVWIEFNDNKEPGAPESGCV